MIEKLIDLLLHEPEDYKLSVIAMVVDLIKQRDDAVNQAAMIKRGNGQLLSVVCFPFIDMDGDSFNISDAVSLDCLQQIIDLNLLGKPINAIKEIRANSENFRDLRQAKHLNDQVRSALKLGRLHNV